MKPYLDLLKDVRHNGTAKADRTGTGTLSVFGRQLRFDCARLPGGDDEEAAGQVHLPRAALVSTRGYESPLPARERRGHLGRVGRCRRRARSHLRCPKRDTLLAPAGDASVWCSARCTTVSPRRVAEMAQRHLTPLSGPRWPDSRARTVPPNLSELCHSSTCMMTFKITQLGAFTDELVSLLRASRHDRIETASRCVSNASRRWRETTPSHGERPGITDAPPPLPHPDHIEIDLRAGTARIVGPMTKEEKAVCDLWVAQKQELVAKIEKLQEEFEAAEKSSTRKKACGTRSTGPWWSWGRRSGTHPSRSA